MPAKRTPTTVSEYVALRVRPVRAILKVLRALVKSSVPGAVEGMKWGAPVYSTPGGEPFAYLYGAKDHANLGFLRGVELNDPEKLLVGKGKSGRHIKIDSDTDMSEKKIWNLLRESAELATRGGP